MVMEFRLHETTTTWTPSSKNTRVSFTPCYSDTVRSFMASYMSISRNKGIRNTFSELR